ncbi:hypothetical protein Tco_0027894, partial [Tanacetum coccineum]
RYVVLEGSDTAYWVTWHGLHDYNILEYSSSASLYGVLDLLDMAYSSKSGNETHRTPKATRTPNHADVIQKKRKERDEIHEATHLSFALQKIIKIHEEQQNMVAVKEYLLAKDVEKIDKENPEEVDDDDDDKMKDDKKDDDDDDDDDNDDDDHTNHALIKN